MLGQRPLAAALLCAAVSGLSFAADASKLDKAKLEQFIRYTEGYTAIVKIDIGDPEPSPIRRL